jgi:hypothetical protein
VQETQETPLGCLPPLKWNQGWHQKLVVNDEIPMRLTILLMKLVPATKMFNQLCVDFKARVEKVKTEGDLQTKETVP